MKLFSKRILEKKLGIFQWNIGFIEMGLDAIMDSASPHLNICWLKHPYRDRFFADPFILNVAEDKIEVLVEEFFYAKWKGVISLLTISRADYRLTSRKILLELDTHLSFPYIFEENGRTYVIPENSQGGSLFIYTYNHKKQILEYPQKMIHAPLVDPVIIKPNDTYFLLCTSLKFEKDEDLLLYYSDSLTGPYTPFSGNPVKQDITSVRSGGCFYYYSGCYYRCTQNSKNSYGASLNICNVETIEKDIFKEDVFMNILPDSDYMHGLHTLDCKGNICVVDGLKYIYKPMLKIKRKLISIK